MAMTGLRQLEVRWSHEPGSPVARLRGDVDASAAVDVDALTTVVNEVPTLVLDLANITFVDVCGLDLLESLAARPNVQVRHVNAVIARVLERTDRLAADWPALRVALAAERRLRP